MVPGFENVRVTRSSFWVREAVEDAFMTLECLDSELRAKMERGRATTEGTLFAPISSLSTTLTETPEKLSRHTMLWHACHMSQAIYYSNRPPTRLNLDRMSSRLGDFPSFMIYFTPRKDHATNRFLRWSLGLNPDRKSSRQRHPAIWLSYSHL